MIKNINEKIVAFNNYIIENSSYFEMLEAMRVDFITNNKNISNLTLDDYCLGYNSKLRHSFCYELEYGIKKIGSLNIRNKKGYGVYYDKNGNIIVNSSFGVDANCALSYAKKEIQEIINNNKTNKNYKLDINIQRKIAAIYHPLNHVFIYSERYINDVLRKIDIDVNNCDFESKESKLINFKNSNSTASKWTNIEYMYFIDIFVHKNKEIKDLDSYKLARQRTTKEVHRDVQYRILKGTVTKKEVYLKNAQVSINAKIDANYSCEIDVNHRTFINKDGNNYVEAHHIIPMSYQKDFNNSLDIEDNIICLCPNCHRQIHQAKDNDSILRKVFVLKEVKLCKMGISSIRKLKKYY